MAIVEKFSLMAKGKEARIGIGLGNSKLHNFKILDVCVKFLQKFKSKIYAFGNNTSINQVQNENLPTPESDIVLIESGKLEQKIFEFLKDNTINSIIRGSLGSNSFLANFKSYLNAKKINRLALLETVEGHQFFYGPVGIDECNNVENKIEFLQFAIKKFGLLGITPIISILSGGRRGDIGRDTNVDDSIKNGDEVVSIMKKRYPDLKISHDEILIEKAIENKSNLIIAPNGISGNLIYRTLVHLGGGKAYGAIYNTKQAIIDTSRVAKSSEILGALMLGLALSN